jgi:hypothetical protein
MLDTPFVGGFALDTPLAQEIVIREASAAGFADHLHEAIREVAPVSADDLAALRNKAARFESLSAQALIDQAAHTVAMESTGVRYRSAVADLETLRDRALELAEEAITAGDADAARQANDEAENANIAIRDITAAWERALAATKQAYKLIDKLAVEGERIATAMDHYGKGGWTINLTPLAWGLGIGLAALAAVQLARRN